ncbi:hypothetical protein CEXT_492081 [Caerostris extrusa]|uniref:Pericentrin/AKAP-450 centrosomal targeting domain-containing protein n=1 Tax=Caerostris extrusa TaxID=172846 RepID=A0AAV4SK94_CAEEX|nr:hypothetical protein CEXT_492081 [Caerostris extrusa]
MITLESSLRAARKDLELEQVQVDTLLQELGSLTGYQKRLEQDYDTIQEMMQQKERELATLHEETDAQMKLEAEVECLERELEDQKSIELELRQIMRQMETALEVSKNTLKSENAQWRLRVESLEKAHCLEIENLKKQNEVLCRNISSSEVEDIDLVEVRKEILYDAGVAFGFHDSKAYGDLIYALLKKAVDIKLSQMVKKHEAFVKEINESWENKIKTEFNTKNYNLNSQCEELKKENLLLKEKFQDQNQRLSCEKDSLWQTKLKESEITLRQELETKYGVEINDLKCALDNVSKEKSSTVIKVKDLTRQLKEQKLKFQAHKNQLLKDFEDKIISAKREQEKLEGKQQTESIFKQEIERLQTELHSKLEKERMVEESHRQEISKLHKFFETRWVDEMKKIQEIQIEELKKLKDSKERNVEALCNHLFAQYSDKLKKLQEDYAAQLAEERKVFISQHKAELQNLQQALEKRFENEKQNLLEIKEKEMKNISESLEKKYSKKITDLRKDKSLNNHNMSSGKDSRNPWEEERLELISLHNKEIVDLKEELEKKYDMMLQSQMISHEVEMKSLEDAYSQKVEEVHELIREARRIASKSCHSDSGSNRTTTPSSEMSSDEACSSCQEDMLPGNKHILVNKIHQDGKRVLNLIESSLATTSTEREARLWIEERKWIVKRIQILTPEVVDNPTNLKLIISNIVDELLNARQKLINYNEEINKNEEKFSQLEQQLDTEHSKVYIIATNLSHQTKVIKELEALLNSRTSEIIELKKYFANVNSTQYQNLTGKDALSQNHSENLSSSYDVGCLRSADEPKSADKFSMFLPELDSLHLQKSGDEIEVTREGMASLPQLTKELDQYLDGSISPESLGQYSRNDIFSVREELMSKLSDKGPQASYEAKLHGLYWVYKRSMSYSKSLVYQKKYLLMLLRGFQVTEKVTEAWLHRMDNDISPRPQGDDTVINEPPLRGRSLFRSAALVAVAIQRMKFYVRRWRFLARIPSSQVVDAEIRTVFLGYSAFSPTLTPGGCNSSLLSLSSKATSISGTEHLSNSQSLVNSRPGSKTKEKYSTPDKRQLIEYVHRLETLQKHLGLDNIR